MMLKLNNGNEYRIVPNNEQNIVDTYKLRVIQCGDTLLKENGLKDWKIECQQLKDKYLGLCVYNSKTILINTTCLYILNYKDIINVMLHEIAHALVSPNHNHDEIWHAKAIEIGCDGKTQMEFKELIKVGEDKYRIILYEK